MVAGGLETIWCQGNNHHDDVGRSAYIRSAQRCHIMTSSCIAGSLAGPMCQWSMRTQIMAWRAIQSWSGQPEGVACVWPIPCGLKMTWARTDLRCMTRSSRGCNLRRGPRVREAVWDHRALSHWENEPGNKQRNKWVADLSTTPEYVYWL